jgi:hypothetical protein
MKPEQFGIIQRQLDELDIVTCIVPVVTGKLYEVIVNSEIKKQYKSRRSAKSFIIKLLKQHEQHHNQKCKP